MPDLADLIQRLREPISVRTTTPINPDGPEAADKLEAMQAALERLRDHISEQITFAQTRIQDGKEMGAAIWRIALEDVVHENQIALNLNRERG